MAGDTTGRGTAESIRRRALYRLTVAGAVTAVALLALWWLDRREEPAGKTPPATPAPIVSAPAGTAPPEPVAPPPQEAPQNATPSPPPPPPAVAAVPTMPPPAAKPPEPARGGAAPAGAEPSPTPPPPEGSGFVLQLGVFANPDNAQELVRKLRGMGIRAHTETRVQIGPYASREEAAKAQAELLRLGYRPVIAPATTR